MWFCLVVWFLNETMPSFGFYFLVFVGPQCNNATGKSRICFLRAHGFCVFSLLRAIDSWALPWTQNPNGGYDKMPASWRGRTENRSMLLVHMDQRCWGADQLQSLLNLFPLLTRIVVRASSTVLLLETKWSWRGWNVSRWPKQTKNAGGAMHRPSTSTWMVSFWNEGFSIEFLNTVVCGLVVRACFVFISQPFLRDHRSTDARLFKDRSRRLHHCHQAGEPHRQTCARSKWSWPTCDQAELCFSVSNSVLVHFVSGDTADVARDVAGLVNQDRSTTGRWIASSPRLSDPEAECGRCWDAASTFWKAELGSSWPSDCGGNCWYHSQERIRQCTVEQVADSPVPQIVEEISEVMRLRTAEQIAQELLLGLCSCSGPVSTWINVSPSMSVGYRKIVFQNRSRSRLRMLQPTSVKKADSNSELWTVHEMAWPTSINPWTSGNHYFKVLLCKQPDTKSCLWQALTGATWFVHQKASIDFAAAMFVCNWLFRITLMTSWTRRQNCFSGICMSPCRGEFVPAETYELPDETTLLLAPYASVRGSVVPAVLAGKSTCTSQEESYELADGNITTWWRSASPVRESVFPAKFHQQMIMKRNLDIRKDVYDYVVLSGGTTIFSKNWDGGCFPIHDEVQSSCFTKEKVLGVVAWAKRFRCARVLFQPCFISWSYRLTRRLFCSCFCF